MRGPYERLKYDFSRVWECPNCQRRERTGFTTTSCFCRCRVKEEGNPLVCMKLVEDGVRRVLEPVCRPRPEQAPRPAQAQREAERPPREDLREGQGPPPRERSGKPPRDKRGRGEERPGPQLSALQHEQVVGVDLPPVAPASEIVVTPPEASVPPVAIDAAPPNVPTGNGQEPKGTEPEGQ
jgi:hypothetical protein